MMLSIVTTLYRSAPHVREFHRRAAAAARAFVANDSPKGEGEGEYEIIMVDDGSPDDSLDIALELLTGDPHLVVVELSRNFGHHKALMAGLAQARGDLVFLIDSDLEEQPEWLLPFEQQLAAEKCDVVFGVQKTRKGGWFERWSGELYYSMLTALSDLKLPRNAVTARLMSKKYVAGLLMHRECDPFLYCLCALAGFKQRSQSITKKSSNPSTYSLFLKMEMALNSIMSFSAAPLHLIFFTGLAVFLLSLLWGGYLLAKRMFFSIVLDGWTSIMLSVWMLGGLIILFLGVIGNYLARVFIEGKRRPFVIVREIHGKRM
jgi:putative glycosyltransferase